MATVIEMPKLSDTMEEGAIANWLKKEGEKIEEGENFVEIETDKATMEYASPAEGILLKILVPSGKSCPLNAPIAVVGESGEKFDLAALLGASKKPSGPQAAGHHGGEKLASGIPSGGAAAAPQSQPMNIGNAGAISGGAALTSSPSAPDGKRIKSSPLARKVAQEKGVDLRSIAGSGPGGRVILRDVESLQPANLSGSGAKFPQSYSHGAMGAREDQWLELSMMRKTIAKRLLSAKNDAPHFYLTVSADMERCLGWREKLNSGLPKEERVSVNDLVTFAVARSLRLHPQVNASWQGDKILQHGAVHVALAVALPTGLVTPVLRNTDFLGVRDVAAMTKMMVGKAKAGQLGNEDYTSGTFTISNLGMFGIEEFTAIINPPQAAILAVGAVMKVPTVNDKGEIAVQSRMKMTLSCDHRVIDGAVGAQFLQTLVGFLEDPLMILA